TADRERLRTRGLTDSEIEAGLFFSLDPEIELDSHFPHIPDNFSQKRVLSQFRVPSSEFRVPSQKRVLS
ncbi:MAG: hypothetical protein LRZ84_07350, partial [Desertifilum sp.]|nr:hypothetical protein [Desertifilum sp.]